MGVWYKSAFYETNRWVFRVFTKICFRIEVFGSSKIPEKGPVIIASNHASVLDPILVATHVPRQLTFIAKEELFRQPLKWYLETVGAEPIRRGSADRAPLRAGLRALARSEAIILFPEGTRSRTGALLPGKAGVGKLAMASHATVVPAWVGGSFAAMPPGARMFRPAKVRVAFGDPIPWEEWQGLADDRTGYQAVSDRVMREIFALSERCALRSTRPHLEESRKNLVPGETSAVVPPRFESYQ